MLRYTPEVLASGDYDAFSLATDAIRSLGGSPALTEDLDFSLDAFERHLNWAISPVIDNLLRPLTEPWLLEVTRRDWELNTLSLELYCCPSSAVAVAKARAILDTSRTLPEELLPIEDTGWELRCAGQMVARAQPMKFNDVSEELLSRTRRIFRGLKSNELVQAYKRTADLPGLRHSIPDLEGVRKSIEAAPPKSVNKSMVLAEFEPGEAAKSFADFAREFGVELTPGQARQALAQMWCIKDWHGLMHRWNSLPATAPTLVTDEEYNVIGIARDVPHALGLLELHSRKKGTEWGKGHELRYHLSYNYSLATAVFISPRNEPEHRHVAASATLIDPAEASDSYLLPQSSATSLEVLKETFGIGLEPAQALVATEKRQGVLASMNVRGVRLCRMENFVAVYAFDEAGKPTLQKPEVCGALDVRHAHNSLKECQAYLAHGRFSLTSDYDNKLVLQFENASLAEAQKIADFLEIRLTEYTAPLKHEA